MPPCSPYGGHGPDQYLFKTATSNTELLLAFRLLYHEYRRAGYTTQSQAEILFTGHHLLPETAVLLARTSDSLLSTATVVRDSSTFGLPMDDLYRREVDRLRDEGRTLVEICSLASDGKRFRLDGMQSFTRMLFQYCIALDVDDICIMVNPRHVPLYRDRCRFEVFGKERHYARVNAPAVALRANVRTLKAGTPALIGIHALPFQADALCPRDNPRLCENVKRTLEGKHAEKCRNPMDKRLLTILRRERADIFRKLPHDFADALDRLYPL